MPQMTTWRTRIACRIPKATNTHSEYYNSLFLRCNSGSTNDPHCYVICLPLVTDVCQLIVFHWIDLCPILLHYVLYKASCLSCTHYKFPILLLSCCVLWFSYEFLTNSPLGFINIFPSLFTPPYFNHEGAISGVEELEILVSWIWFSLLSASPSQWPRGLRHGSAATHLLGLRVRIPQEAWMFVSVSSTCCHVEVPASDWSRVKRSPT